MAQDTLARVIALGTTAKIEEVSEAVDKLLSEGVRYKGVVSYYDLLPTDNAKIGDLYTIKYQGKSEDAGTAAWGAEYVCAKIEDGVAYYEEIGLATQATVVGNNLVLGQAVGNVVDDTLVF